MTFSSKAACGKWYISVSNTQIQIGAVQHIELSLYVQVIHGGEKINSTIKYVFFLKHITCLTKLSTMPAVA